MGFKLGIVGLPNVGKSTLFNALTEAQNAQAENYPFCTIEPNVGMVAVPDIRLEAISKIVNPQKIVPTHIQFVDIAGLVEGASAGEGLGNQFLAHIRETHAIAHIVRCHDDKDITHVSGGVDPVRDCEVIDTELLLADLQTVAQGIIRWEKKAKSDAKARAVLAELKALEAYLNEGKRASRFPVDQDAQWYKELHLLTAKPMMIIANVSDTMHLDENIFYQNLVQSTQDQDVMCFPICARLEAQMAGMLFEEKQAFLEEIGMHEPGLEQLIRLGYQLLGLKTFFTAGEKEVHAWTTHKDANAVVAAGEIHTDFMKHFIRAEVIGYDDYITCGGELKAKELGRWRLEGKDYLVIDGDVIYFRVGS